MRLKASKDESEQNAVDKITILIIPYFCYQIIKILHLNSDTRK